MRVVVRASDDTRSLLDSLVRSIRLVVPRGTSWMDASAPGPGRIHYHIDSLDLFVRMRENVYSEVLKADPDFIRGAVGFARREETKGESDAELTKSKNNKSSNQTKAKQRKAKQSKTQQANLKTMPSMKTHPYTAAQEDEIPVNVEQQYSAAAGGPPAPAPAAVVSSSYKYSGDSSVESRIESPRYIRIDTRKPVTLSYCPKCVKAHVTTTTRTKVTGPTLVCVVVGAVIFWPLCWIPLVVKPMKQTNHYCQNCGVKVGRVKPFQ